MSYMYNDYRHRWKFATKIIRREFTIYLNDRKFMLTQPWLRNFNLPIIWSAVEERAQYNNSTLLPDIKCCQQNCREVTLETLLVQNIRKMQIIYLLSSGFPSLEKIPFAFQKKNTMDKLLIMSVIPKRNHSAVNLLLQHCSFVRVLGMLGDSPFAFSAQKHSILTTSQWHFQLIHLQWFFSSSLLTVWWIF